MNLQAPLLPAILAVLLPLAAPAEPSADALRAEADALAAGIAPRLGSSVRPGAPFPGVRPPVAPDADPVAAIDPAALANDQDEFNRMSVRFPKESSRHPLTPDDAAVLADVLPRLTNLAATADAFATPGYRSSLPGLVFPPDGPSSPDTYFAEPRFTDAIDKASIDWTPPKIYTPGQTTIILRVAEEVAPDLVPIFALGAFAGIRSSGALRLRPDAIDISGGVVTVPGYADKLRRGYITPVTDALRAWLSVYPFTGWQRSRQAFYVAVDRLSEKYRLPLTRNGFRHSYASYLYAKTQDVRAVASALGHLGEVETLLRSYRRLISPDLADAYFAIRPSEHVYGRD